jgi:hypothetical protein
MTSELDLLLEKHAAAREDYKTKFVQAARDFSAEITPYILDYDSIVEKADMVYFSAIRKSLSERNKRKLGELREHIKKAAFERLLEQSIPAREKLDEKIRSAQVKFRRIEEAIEKGEEIEL